jgi:hypothetical protein
VGRHLSRAGACELYWPARQHLESSCGKSAASAALPSGSPTRGQRINAGERTASEVRAWLEQRMGARRSSHRNSGSRQAPVMGEDRRTADDQLVGDKFACCRGIGPPSDGRWASANRPTKAQAPASSQTSSVLGDFERVIVHRIAHQLAVTVGPARRLRAKSLQKGHGAVLLHMNTLFGSSEYGPNAGQRT